jgi:hypothetical protein
MTLVNAIEPFVDATAGAEFFAIRPRRLLELAREGKVPAHPLGDGPRRTWRFRLSELAKSLVFTSSLTRSIASTQAVPGDVQ